MAYSWKMNLYVLWTGVFFCSTAFSVVIPFLPIFLHDQLHVESHLETWSGLIFGITFLASALIAPYWGSLADKYGRRPMLIRSGFFLALLYFITYFVHNPYELLVIRILQGVLAGYVPSAVALVATNTPEKNVGYALGIMSTATATGSIIGPLIGGVVSHWLGSREAFLVSAGLVSFSFLIALFWAKETNFNRTSSRSSVKSDLKEAMSNRRLLSALLMVMATSTSIMLLEPLLTIYVLQLGATKGSASLSAGVIFSAVGIATIIAAPQWGKAGTRFGFGNILFIGLLGGAIGNLLQLLFHNLIGFGVLRFSYGLFFAAVFPSLNALIVQATEPSFRGRAFSLNQSAMQIGNLLGPVIGGILAGLLTIPLVFLINGIALLAIAILLKYKKEEDKKLQQQQTSLSN
ncbi:MFS transporter [Paenibacillus cremeus]|uniref:Multidrug efflux MFS transporter n=1 Tax=Paenibacillus cremeus TaxID=2163881 RepID=A0A559JDE7_9BACL|nr:MFS transporter [Paenibacillus cremeus]TVX97897.1 multidrug efflux MFS transporter [Paenibacillus cremeus]